jgi:hypothetical protein
VAVIQEQVISHDFLNCHKHLNSPFGPIVLAVTARKSFKEALLERVGLGRGDDIPSDIVHIGLEQNASKEHRKQLVDGSDT